MIKSQVLIQNAFFDKKDIWLISDLHAFHKNVCRGTSSWEDKSGCRDFDTIEQMSDVVFGNINAVVKPEDILIHGGDWAFGGVQNIEIARKRINCKTVIHINGNHDHNIRKFKHLQDLFFECLDYLEFYVDKKLVCCFHYPIDEWNEINRGSVMLYGHTHQRENLFQDGRKMNIGLDSNDMKPYNLREVLDTMSKIEVIRKHHA